MSSEARTPAAAGVSAVVRRQAAAEVPLAARLVDRRKRKSRAGSAPFLRAGVKACKTGIPLVERGIHAGGRPATRRVPPVARSARAAWRLESMGFQEVYRYTPGKADWLAAGWETEGTLAKKPRIRQMIHKDVPTCSLRERLEDVKSRRRPNQDMCVVVNDRNIVMGVIQGETWDANPLARIADVMQPGPRTIRPDLDPKDAQKILRNYDASAAIVTTSDGELLGIIRIAQKKPQKANKAA